jgi:hypothetical protein
MMSLTIGHALQIVMKQRLLSIGQAKQEQNKT